MYKNYNNIISISTNCIETFPCQHEVVYNGKSEIMMGPKIQDLFIKHKLDVPNHFNYLQNINSEHVSL